MKNMWEDLSSHCRSLVDWRSSKKKKKMIKIHEGKRIENWQFILKFYIAPKLPHHINKRTNQIHIFMTKSKQTFSTIIVPLKTSTKNTLWKAEFSPLAFAEKCLCKLFLFNFIIYIRYGNKTRKTRKRHLGWQGKSKTMDKTREYVFLCLRYTYYIYLYVFIYWKQWIQTDISNASPTPQSYLSLFLLVILS